MTPKQFIEKAIEGGFHIDVPRVYPSVYTDEEKKVVYTNIKDIILDPKAWQAVGKVEGWDEKNVIRTYTISTADNTKSISQGLYPWQINMHRMIDSLIEGKTVEQFLETL